MVKPIPLHLLRDTVTYEEYEGSERWGDSWKAPITLSNVRVQESSDLILSSTSERRDFTHLMFVDAVNTKASADYTLLPKSKVTYNNTTYRVNKVTACKGFTIHHYEIELS